MGVGASASAATIKLNVRRGGAPEDEPMHTIEVDPAITWSALVQMVNSMFSSPKRFMLRLPGRDGEVPPGATLQALGLVNGSVVETVWIMD